MKRILVIGATGTVGRQVISELIAANFRVRALTRNPDSANLPSQAEIFRGDLTILVTLEQSVDNVDQWTFLCALALRGGSHRAGR